MLEEKEMTIKQINQSFDNAKYKEVLINFFLNFPIILALSDFFS